MSKSKTASNEATKNVASNDEQTQTIDNQETAKTEDAPKPDETKPDEAKTDEAKTDEAAKVPEPTSPLLTELRAQLSTAKKAMKAADEDSEDEKAAMAAIDAANKAIAAELVAIKQREALAIIEEQKNSRVQMAVNLLKAAGLNDDQISEVQKSKEYEIIVNELLAKFANSTPSKSAATNDTAKAAGSKAENLALHLANLAKGMDDKQSREALEAAGVPKSTAWHTVNNYNKSKAA